MSFARHVLRPKERVEVVAVPLSKFSRDDAPLNCCCGEGSFAGVVVPPDFPPSAPAPLCSPPALLLLGLGAKAVLRSSTDTVPRGVPTWGECWSGWSRAVGLVGPEATMLSVSRVDSSPSGSVFRRATCGECAAAGRGVAFVSYKQVARIMRVVGRSTRARLDTQEQIQQKS